MRKSVRRLKMRERIAPKKSALLGTLTKTEKFLKKSVKQPGMHFVQRSRKSAMKDLLKLTLTVMAL